LSNTPISVKPSLLKGVLPLPNDIFHPLFAINVVPFETAKLQLPVLKTPISVNPSPLKSPVNA
jgi:hypothetical protein